MAKLTDLEVIKHFELRKQTLTQELKKIEVVLSALAGNGSPGNQPPVKKRTYTRRKPAVTSSPASKVKTAEAQVKKIRTAKNTPSKGVKKSTPKRQISPALADKSSSKVSWDSKIQNALSQLGSGTKERIVEFIADKDSSVTPEKINKALTLRLAVMLKGGKLQKDATGNQYRLG